MIMKVELDFDNKIIKLETDVKLLEFVKKITEILPDWQSWTLETNTTIEWAGSYPIIRPPYVPPYIGTPIWYGTCADPADGDISMTGTAKIEI